MDDYTKGFTFAEASDHISYLYQDLLLEDANNELKVYATFYLKEKNLESEDPYGIHPLHGVTDTGEVEKTLIYLYKHKTGKFPKFNSKGK